MQFIILLLEGLKSILNILTLSNAISFFLTVIMPKDGEAYDSSSPSVIDAFKKLGVNITEEEEKFDSLTGMVTPEVIDFESQAMVDKGLTIEIFQIAERTARTLAVAAQQVFKVSHLIITYPQTLNASSTEIRCDGWTDGGQAQRLHQLA